MPQPNLQSIILSSLSFFSASLWHRLPACDSLRLITTKAKPHPNPKKWPIRGKVSLQIVTNAAGAGNLAIILFSILRALPFCLIRGHPGNEDKLLGRVNNRLIVICVFFP